MIDHLLIYFLVNLEWYAYVMFSMTFFKSLYLQILIGNLFYVHACFLGCAIFNRLILRDMMCNAHDNQLNNSLLSSRCISVY